MKNALKGLRRLVLVLVVDAAFWLLVYWALKTVQSLTMAVRLAVRIVVLWALYA